MPTEIRFSGTFFCCFFASDYTYIGNPRVRGLRGIRRNRRNRGIRWYAESARIGQNRPKIGQNQSKSAGIPRLSRRKSFVSKGILMPLQIKGAYFLVSLGYIPNPSPANNSDQIFGSLGSRDRQVLLILRSDNFIPELCLDHRA